MSLKVNIFGHRLLSFLLPLVIRLAYYCGLDALFYFVNRRAKRIVTFHNVIPQSIMPESENGLICFSDEKFKRIVSEIEKRFKFSTDFNDFSTCTLTFDDGYLNQLEIAGRILREKGIPAVLFLASDLLESDSPLAVDQCLVWAAHVPMDVAGKFFGRSFSDRISLWQQGVRPLFALDGKNRGREALRRLNEAYPVEKCLSMYSDGFRRLRYTGVSKKLVDEFRLSGWTIAHHTRSHFPVKDLSAEDARQEMSPPEGMEHLAFSFPYGDGGSVSARDVAIVKDLGYPLAVSNEVERTPLSGRYFLPRFMLTSDDKYLIHFQLSGLKYFLKYGRLLPVVNSLKA